MVRYPAYKVAAAHVAPVFLDTDRSVGKACSVIEEAAGHGARLIAFPEAFLPGFPVWAALFLDEARDSAGSEVPLDCGPAPRGTTAPVTPPCQAAQRTGPRTA